MPNYNLTALTILTFLLGKLNSDPNPLAPCATKPQSAQALY